MLLQALAIILGVLFVVGILGSVVVLLLTTLEDLSAMLGKDDVPRSVSIDYRD